MLRSRNALRARLGKTSGRIFAFDPKRTSHQQLPAVLRRGPSGPWREDNNNRADLYATVKVNHVLVGHANAARRDGSADVFWLIGAMDAVLRVVAAGVQI